MNRVGRGNKAGFTLMELVVGSTVMVGIIASAYLCLVSGNKGQRMVERRMAILQNARVALDLMARDLRAACVLHEDASFLGMDRTRKGPDGGEIESDNLDFATHNHEPAGPGESDACEVSYFIDRNPRTGGLCLFRRRDTTPDADPLSGGTREEIAEGVRGFRLEYFNGLHWYDRWGESPTSRETYSNDPDRTTMNAGTDAAMETGLPEAVRISLALGSEEEERPGRRTGARVKSPPLLFQSVVRLYLARRPRGTGNVPTEEDVNASGVTSTEADITPDTEGR